MTHPNKDILVALANGEEIEWRYKEGKWWQLQVGSPSRLDADAMVALLGPEYYPDYSFRIKPKKVMIRHACDAGGNVFVFTQNFNKQETNAAEMAEKNNRMIWLDEWHEASFGPEGE